MRFSNSLARLSFAAALLGATALYLAPAMGQTTIDPTILPTPAVTGGFSSGADFESVIIAAPPITIVGGGTITTAATPGTTIGVITVTDAVPVPPIALAPLSPDLRDDQESVAYQINPAHTGAITFDKSFKPPLKVLWNDTAEGPMSYPLIARGKVFVYVAHASGGGRIYALDKHSGGALWHTDLPGTSLQNPNFGPLTGANMAYDHGHILAVNAFDVLTSLNADTGAQEWTLQLQQLLSSAPPTAANGMVFVGGTESGGTLYAVDEATGTLRWSQSVANGDESSPTLSDDDVFVTYPCQVYDFKQQTGAPVWNFAGGCDGGGGVTPVYYRRHLYDTIFTTLNSPRPAGNIFDTDTGEIVGGFGGIGGFGIVGPAFKGDVRYYSTIGIPQAGKLIAEEIDSGTALWSFTPDTQIAFPPVVINDTVFAFTQAGTLYALDGITGEQLWSANGGSAASISGVGGMAAGEGILVVPDGLHLYALAPDDAE